MGGAQFRGSVNRLEDSRFDSDFVDACDLDVQKSIADMCLTKARSQLAL